MSLSTTGQMLAQRDAFGDTLVELIDRDERVYVLDGDLANSTKADIVSRERPDRFLMMGIAEQNMMGVAAGMATCGLVPWLSSFACFIVNRDLDQLRVVVAQPNLPVKLCGAYSGLLTGKTGKTHQDVSDVSVMRAMPNMTVLAPADAVEVAACMRVANDLPGPVYVRMTRDPEPVIFPADYQFELHRARRHLEFMVKLYRRQAECGRYFLHEHPAHASSWKEPCMVRLTSTWRPAPCAPSA